MRKAYFLFLLIAITLFGIPACITVNDSFGADYIPGDQRLSVKVHTINNIPVYTADVDSIPIGSYDTYAGVFGYVNIPPYGSTASNMVFRIYPAYSEHNFGENPEFVSATLTLVISKRAVPYDNQENIVQNIRLYELTKDLSYDTMYYNNSISYNDYNPVQINAPGLSYNGGDTLLIPITKTYGDFLLSGTASDMDSLAHFYQKYKGFLLAVDPLPTGVTGGRMNTADISTSYLTLYYKNDEGRDTAMVYYGDYGLALSITEHEAPGLLANYAQPLPTPEPIVYYESRASVKPVFDLAAINDSITIWLDKIGLRADQLLLNKAELILSIDPSANLDKYPSDLALCRLKINDSGKLTYPIIEDVAGSFGGTINRSLLMYSFNITYYLQQLLTEGTSDTLSDTLYAFPSMTAEDSYGNSYTVINNNDYSFGQFLGYNSSSPPKLKLVYTVLY